MNRLCILRSNQDTTEEMKKKLFSLTAILRTEYPTTQFAELLRVLKLRDGLLKNIAGVFTDLRTSLALLLGMTDCLKRPSLWLYINSIPQKDSQNDKNSPKTAFTFL